MRLIDLYLKTLQIQNPEHGTRNSPPFSRTPSSKIHVFCNQHQVGGRLSKPVTSQTQNMERGTRNILTAKQNLPAPGMFNRIDDISKPYIPKFNTHAQKHSDIIRQ